jgi:hypothetical protein
MAASLSILETVAIRDLCGPVKSRRTPEA